MLEKIKQCPSILRRIAQMRIPFIAALCAAAIGAAALLTLSVNTVRISDGDKIYTVRTIAGDVESALSSVALKSSNYRVLKTDVGGRITDVAIAYTFPVYITVGDNTTEHITTAATVAEILADAGIDVDEYDMVEPSADTLITETAYIDFSDIDYVSGTYTEAIPCVVNTVYSDEQLAGTTKLKNGTDGLKQIEYTAKLVNGVEVEKVINNTVTLSQAVNGTKVVGTKVEEVKPSAVITSDTVKSVSTLKPSSPIELDGNGNPVNFKKHITVQATAYTYTGNNCATGVAPQPGYIAVNPKVIPYGTKMYIKSSDGSYIYGYAVAADTGGFVRKYPNNVDLFFSTKSACSAFGRRNVEIYILE